MIDNKSIVNENKEIIKIGIAKKLIPEWKQLGLKLKEIKFLAEYINVGNKTEAYVRSFAKKGTKRSVAATEACRVFKRPHVSKAYQLWKENYLDVIKLELEPNIINVLLRRAFFDVNIFFNDDGSAKKVSEIPEEWRCVIDGLEKKYYGRMADVSVDIFKLADRDKAITKLQEYIGMKKDDTEPTGVSAEIKINLMNILHGKKPVKSIE